jgi:hypothetical protein
MIKRVVVERSANGVMFSKQASGSMVELESCLSEYRVKAVVLEIQCARRHRRHLGSEIAIERLLLRHERGRMFTARMRTFTAD